jgi:hypothetical protein
MRYDRRARARHMSIDDRNLLGGETEGPVLEYRRLERPRLRLERSQLSSLIGCVLCGAVAAVMWMVFSGLAFDLDFGDFHYIAFALALMATGGSLIFAGGLFRH